MICKYIFFILYIITVFNFNILRYRNVLLIFVYFCYKDYPPTQTQSNKTTAKNNKTWTYQPSKIKAKIKTKFLAFQLSGWKRRSEYTNVSIYKHNIVHVNIYVQTHRYTHTPSHACFQDWQTCVFDWSGWPGSGACLKGERWAASIPRRWSPWFQPHCRTGRYLQIALSNQHGVNRGIWCELCALQSRPCNLKDEGWGFGIQQKDSVSHGREEKWYLFPASLESLQWVVSCSYRTLSTFQVVSGSGTSQSIQSRVALWISKNRCVAWNTGTTLVHNTLLALCQSLGSQECGKTEYMPQHDTILNTTKTHICVLCSTIWWWSVRQDGAVSCFWGQPRRSIGSTTVPPGAQGGESYFGRRQKPKKGSYFIHTEKHHFHVWRFLKRSLVPFQSFDSARNRLSAKEAAFQLGVPASHGQTTELFWILSSFPLCWDEVYGSMVFWASWQNIEPFETCWS